MGDKVLIVDDEKEFAQALAERMRIRGMDVSTCISPFEAISMIESKAYDVVILDFKMPEMDGIEVLSKIKQKLPEIQIILLTGHATIDMSIKALKLGAFDFLEKPVNIQTLIEEITNAKKKKMLIVEKQKLINKQKSHK